MHKTSFALLLVVVLFIGILIGKPSGNSMNITQEELDNFEDKLDEGNYQQIYQSIEPNTINSIGKKIENVLDSLFGKLND